MYHPTEFFVSLSFIVCSGRANLFQYRNQDPIVFSLNIIEYLQYNILLNIHHQFTNYNIKGYSW